MSSLRKRTYPSDLNDHDWEVIKGFIPKARKGGRPRKTNTREVLNAIFYLLRTGCAWRYLPDRYPPWQTVYEYFCRWRMLGVFRKIHLSLAKNLRKKLGRSETPNLVIIDGQSVKASCGEERGYDGFKRIRGRKRQILVDSQGILWGLRVHRANQMEGTRASEVMLTYPSQKKPEKVLADAAYGKAPFTIWLRKNWGIYPEVKQSKKIIVRDSKHKAIPKIVDSNLKPKRWIVERSIAWFTNYRRLARDYERKTCNSEAFIYLSQVPILLKRLEQ